MWPQKDSNQYMCFNGISHPIYDCKGWINYSLPLDMYPKINEIHPQIAMTSRLLLNDRSNAARRRYEDRAKGYVQSYDKFSNGMYEKYGPYGQ